MTKSQFKSQFTFMYGKRELECHYSADVNTEDAEPMTWDYPGCPACSTVEDVRLMFVETDEPMYNPCHDGKTNFWKQLQVTDLPSALVSVLMDMAWDDAREKLASAKS